MDERLLGCVDEDDEDWQSEGYQSDTLKQMMTPVDQDSVDEFAIFRQVVMEVQQYDPQWWTALAGSIGETNNVSIVSSHLL